MHSVASSGFGDGFDASDFELYVPVPTAASAPTIEAPRFTLRDSPSLASTHRWHPPAMFGNFPEALTAFDEPSYSPPHDAHLRADELEQADSWAITLVAIWRDALLGLGPVCRQ